MLVKTVALACVLLGVMGAPATAATINVTTTTDVVANDGQCSLREAVTAANTDMPSGSAPGECQADSAHGNEIVLGLGTHALLSGELDVRSPITLTGQGVAASTINAEGLSRVLDVAANGDLTVRDVTLTGGHAPDGADATASAPAGNGGSGGAIDNAGSLTLDDVMLTGNRAGNGGNGFTPTVIGRQPEGNGGGGGGIESSGPSLSIVDSTIANNAAGNGGTGGVSDPHFPVDDNGGNGGGIDIADGAITIVGSTISGDSGGDAGTPSGASGRVGLGAALNAITGQPVTLTNDTIANNSGFQPPVDVFSSSSTTLSQVTIAGNSSAGSDLSLGTNTTIRDSALDGSCVVAVIDGGHNVSLAGGGCPGKPVAASRFDLGPLQGNGGPTETMLPGAGSALIDEVPSQGAGCLATDQRGVPRPQGGACDAGAVEVHAPGTGLHPRRMKFGRTRLTHIHRNTLRLTYLRGEDPLTVGKARITGRNSRDFRVVADRCRGRSLRQGNSCVVVVSFRPTRRGKRTAKLTITIAAPGKPRTAALLGTGFG